MKKKSVTNFQKRKDRIINTRVCKALVVFLWLVSATTTAQEVTRILPLGDSITQGGNGRTSYRRTLWLKLKQHGFNVDFVGSQQGFHSTRPSDQLLDFDLDHEDHWGWETNQIAVSLSGWLDSYTPDIALVHLGTNDFDRGESKPTQ